MPALPARRRQTSPHRWDPLRDIDELRDRVERLFDDSLTGQAADQTWVPPVDIEEQEDAWVIDADLPGVRREDITVELHDGELAIHGEVKEKDRSGVLRRRARRTGRFDYRVSLPGDLDPEAVEANLSDGVLSVRLRKPERAKPRRIEVSG